MTDELTRRLAGQILRGVKAVHEEEKPGTPLEPGTPVCSHAAAERIRISPVGRWYAATLAYLVEEGALEHNAKARPGDTSGTPPYALGENALGMMREAEGDEPKRGGPAVRRLTQDQRARVEKPA